MKKTWATSASTSPFTHVSTYQQRQQLHDAVNTSVSGVAASLVLPPVTPTKNSVETPSESKDQVIASLQLVEMALAALPPTQEFVVEREMLQAKIASKKKAITSMRPLGSRLDSCKQAIDRAQTRLETAKVTTVHAQADETQATKDLENLVAELSSLELEVAQAKVMNDSPREQAVSDLTKALQGVFDKLKTDHGVPANILGEAESQMTVLLSGVANIFASAQASAHVDGSAAAKGTAKRSLMRSASDPQSPNNMNDDVSMSTVRRRTAYRQRTKVGNASSVPAATAVNLTVPEDVGTSCL